MFQRSSKFPSCSPCAHPLVDDSTPGAGGAVSVSGGSGGSWARHSSYSSGVGDQRNQSNAPVISAAAVDPRKANGPTCVKGASATRIGRPNAEKAAPSYDTDAVICVPSLVRRSQILVAPATAGGEESWRLDPLRWYTNSTVRPGVARPRSNLA